MGDEVTMGLSVERLGTKSITLDIGCRMGDEQRIRIHQVLVSTSLETHKAIAIPDDLRSAIERFAAR
jgi:4-hydroxybenzoyl-CoA thioesterase